MAATYSGTMPWNRPSMAPLQDRMYGTITDVIKSRTDMWKPKKHELYTTLPAWRFGRTTWPDTRFITHPIPDESIDSFMDEGQRFKTTNLSFSVYSQPDVSMPHLKDWLNTAAKTEFRMRRLQQRTYEMDTRKQLAEEAGLNYENKKIARKALTLLNYERKIRASNG